MSAYASAVGAILADRLPGHDYPEEVARRLLLGDPPITGADVAREVLAAWAVRLDDAAADRLAAEIEAARPRPGRPPAEVHPARVRQLLHPHVDRLTTLSAVGRAAGVSRQRVREALDIGMDVATLEAWLTRIEGRPVRLGEMPEAPSIRLAELPEPLRAERQRLLAGETGAATEIIRLVREAV